MNHSSKSIPEANHSVIIVYCRCLFHTNQSMCVRRTDVTQRSTPTFPNGVFLCWMFGCGHTTIESPAYAQGICTSRKAPVLAFGCTLKHSHLTSCICLHLTFKWHHNKASQDQVFSLEANTMRRVCSADPESVGAACVCAAVEVCGLLLNASRCLPGFLLVSALTFGFWVAKWGDKHAGSSSLQVSQPVRLFQTFLSPHQRWDLRSFSLTSHSHLRSYVHLYCSPVSQYSPSVPRPRHFPPVHMAHKAFPYSPACFHTHLPKNTLKMHTDSWFVKPNTPFLCLALAPQLHLLLPLIVFTQAKSWKRSAVAFLTSTGRTQCLSSATMLLSDILGPMKRHKSIQQ